MIETISEVNYISKDYNYYKHGSDNESKQNHNFIRRCLLKMYSLLLSQNSSLLLFWNIFGIFWPICASPIGTDINQV